MVIGKGDIASALIDQPDKIFFASGVSNSTCTDWKEFQREKDLLMKQNKFSHLVYFSSLCIYYRDTPYARHKKIMEHLVKDNFAVSTIVRLGNITWGDNPNTIINYFKAKIKSKEPIALEDGYRYFVDKDEFTYWMGMIPEFTTEMNITGRRLEIKHVYDKLNNFGEL